MIFREQVLDILKRYGQVLFGERDVDFRFIREYADETGDMIVDLCAGEAHVISNSRNEIERVDIGIKGLFLGSKFVFPSKFCDVLVAMGHEAQHITQLENMKQGGASSELIYSWIADTVSERYYDLNYDLSYREIDAEREGVKFALKVLENEFDGEYANKLISGRMEKVKRVCKDEFGCRSTTSYMLAQVDENFAKRTDWDEMFFELLVRSKTAERSYSPYVYENHYVDDLERFYKRSEENEYFVLKSLNSGKTDKLICAAAIAENSGHYTKNAGWLLEGRSMLVNMKTDMMGYLQRELNDVDNKRLNVDMSTLDSDELDVSEEMLFA